MSDTTSRRKHKLDRDLTPQERYRIIHGQEKRKAKPERGPIQYPDPQEKVKHTKTPAHFVHPDKQRS
jgi:hypothetical protein